MKEWKNVKAFNDIKEKAITWIGQNDPAFFNRFGEEIQSGDHLRIQQALTESGEVMDKVLSSEGDVVGQLMPAPIEDDPGVGCVAVVVCAVAVAVWKYVAAVDVAAAASVAAIAVAVWVWKYQYTYSYEQAEVTYARLWREKMIDSVAQRMKHDKKAKQKKG